MLDRLGFRVGNRAYVLLPERSVHNLPAGNDWKPVAQQEMGRIVERAFQRDPVFRAALQSYVRSTASGLASPWATPADWTAYLLDELCGFTSQAALYESEYKVCLPPVVEVDTVPAAVVETDWIGFRVSDAIGDPVPNVAVEVFLPDDTRRIVYTNATGVANLTGVASGQCRVSILGTYGEAWEVQ